MKPTTTHARRAILAIGGRPDGAKYSEFVSSPRDTTRLRALAAAVPWLSMGDACWAVDRIWGSIRADIIAARA